MKKFSTATAFLAFASILASASAMSRPLSPEAHAQITTRCEFLPNAPDQHLVVRGDTLWGISAMFLQHPWCWPQVWGLNRDQINDPHWIYPGQIVYFDRAAGRLRLGVPPSAGGNGRGSADVRLSPQIRMQNLDKDAIPSIPPGDIEPFLSQPLIVEEEELANTPRIMAAQEGHVNLATGDKAYVRGDLHGGTSFQGFRPGQPLKDPETNKIIGYEAVYLGTLKLERAAKTDNEAHTFTVVSSKEEMGVGDRLLPVPPTPLLNYMPHPPAQQVNARVVSIYGGVAHAGQNQVVSVNRGKNEGLDLGTVLELYRYGPVVQDTTDNKRAVKLPDERYGSLFVFRVFNNISYGLVMQVKDSVQVGDVARSPE